MDKLFGKHLGEVLWICFDPRRHLVLLGGGHSHVHVLKMLGMQPIPNTRVTLISKDVDSPYSGMLPGHVAGIYAFDQCHIDLLRLASFGDCRFIAAEVDGVDWANKEIHFAAGPDGGHRPPLKYDLISVNVGSTPSLSSMREADAPTTALASEASLAEHGGTPVKPISGFSQRWDSTLQAIDQMHGTPRSRPSTTTRASATTTAGARKPPTISTRRSCRVLIVGGGAGGVEMAFAMSARLRGKAKVKLVHSGEVLLSQHGPKAQAVVLKALEEAGVEVGVYVENWGFLVWGFLVEVGGFWCGGRKRKPELSLKLCPQFLKSISVCGCRKGSGWCR